MTSAVTGGCSIEGETSGCGVKGGAEKADILVFSRLMVTKTLRIWESFRQSCICAME